jgi:hypothetical protein
MKLIFSNGRRLEVRHVSAPVYAIEAQGNAMIPLHGYRIVSEEEARQIVLGLRVFDAYRCEAIGQSAPSTIAQEADQKESAE